MIKLLFAPGCYGTYLSWCIYTYTNLRVGQFADLEIDQNGSSHIFRKNNLAKQVLWVGHLGRFEYSESDKIILLQPLQQHLLDYYNNDYHKNGNLDLINYLLTHFSIGDINNKLRTHWGYPYPLSPEVPLWILREFFSFWIIDCFNHSYSIEYYNQHNQIPNDISLTTQDIFENFYDTFKKICQACELIIDVDVESIDRNHNNFLSSQRYHNSQLKCEEWVADTIAGKENTYKPQTIFEEAYIQHIFRNQGYEIECNGLDVFPAHTLEMRKLIYANSTRINTGT